jgi:hypothetical protein
MPRACEFPFSGFSSAEKFDAIQSAAGDGRQQRIEIARGAGNPSLRKPFL